MTGAPFLTGLAPDVHLVHIQGWRQFARTAIVRAQSPGNGLGGSIQWRNGMDDVCPAKMVECPIHRCDAGFSGVALSPRIAMERVADFRPWPAVGLPRASQANPRTTGFLNDG